MVFTRKHGEWRPGNDETTSIMCLCQKRKCSILFWLRAFSCEKKLGKVNKHFGAAKVEEGGRNREVNASRQDMFIDQTLSDIERMRKSSPEKYVRDKKYP